ncbi:hypothetical protein ACQ86N_45590 [Puia sp. P3]|uniref:hypothetical protein n=1 Tax=Puia sp. P3 TaxID=3423952 RepID=UPI003D663FBD
MKRLVICWMTGLLLLAACRGRPTLFRRVPSSRSGIVFNNRIVENDSVNPLSLINLYNGGSRDRGLQPRRSPGSLFHGQPRIEPAIPE